MPYTSVQQYLKKHGIELSNSKAHKLIEDSGLTEVKEVTVKKRFLLDKDKGVQIGMGRIKFTEEALDSVFADWHEQHPTLF